MKNVLLFVAFMLTSTFFNNLYAQLPKSYNFQPKGEPIYVVDGVVATKAYIQKLDKDNIEFMAVLKGEQATKKYGDKAVNGVIEITTKKDNASNNKVKITSPVKAQPIFVVDGVEVKGSLNDISPDDIEKMEVYKGDDAINRYGSRGKNGVIVITTKKEKSDIRLNSKGRVIPDSICYIDGKEIKYSEYKNIDPNSIDKMQVLKGDEAIKKYGDKAKNGVIEIYMKK